MMNIPPQRDDTIELNSKQVRNAAIEVIEPQFEMHVNGYKYTPNEIWDTLLYWKGRNGKHGVQCFTFPMSMSIASG